MVFVHSASADQGEAFFSERWPEAAAIADPDQILYDAFGLGSGSTNQLFGPKVWLAGIRATLGRNGVGLPKGNPMLMSGAYWIRSGRVVGSRPSTHAGDVFPRDAAAHLAEELR